MSIGAFVNKAHPPTIEQVLDAIGSKRPAWEEFTRFLRERFAAKEELKFYGKNYGWALRFRKSGKALVSLYPAEKSFTIQVILSEANVKQTRDLRIGKHVRQIIEQAHAYPEGRWLFIPVKSERDVRDAQELLALKSLAKRKSQ